ncbi:LuxR C-terminal-related transcriptional regulator [Aquibacillus sp. 3ASR75-11]|uniref:LuxR C-terminal-related transcriptional regulator n=1 Tax=Terrihalobacillus insolitus TaxID=2950438 RepID=A0A9X3WYK1_9BACI|nr:LuxR C-terminal-related transcriptional regulator [Terrihalobacillus insolitus]MDC3414564.1 LuxR C-terminal-related transcriptional regulator [Terrihalobacillus insolitus]MDC3425759.1 LuxR C-terminal-related transcriptional regulator [Terrihalobacillus insolitus]
MSLTLNNQMDTLFLKGLQIVQSHHQPILFEWENILSYLKETGKRSGENVEETIYFFSEYLFSLELDETNNLNLNIHTLQRAKSFQTNQFIITLLENAVHKVIQAKEEHSHQDHQAVQYLFLTLSEELLAHPNHQYFSIDSFLKNLVSSTQIPIDWAAIIIKRDQSYIVENWFNSLSQDLLLGNDNLKADTIFNLSELLLNQMPEEKQPNHNVLSIPYEDVTLLICVSQQDNSHITPFITYALQVFQYGKYTFKANKQEQQWKDSVIMFNETIMRSHTYNDAVENISAGFVRYLPFERCALFSYSVNEHMGFGLFGHHLDNTAIQNITEDIRNLPIIQDNMQILQLFGKSMHYLQPIYMADASVGFPVHYIEKFQLHSVVVAPIYLSSNSRLLGAAILDQGPNKHFIVSEDTFSALVKFGQSAGEILGKYQNKQQDDLQLEGSFHLSPRELEIMKLMAKGASTIEAARDLHLSAYTVRDYISAIIQKMDARNRTEAVARAIREGII